MSSDTQLKIFIFLERLWLVSAGISVLLVAYFIITGDNDSALFFFGFFVLSGLLYLLRKRQRVRYQKQISGNSGTYEPGKNRP
jgi:LPXTG-motif cell wall-anchored protein